MTLQETKVEMTADELELCAMLSYCRPCGSKTEKKFIDRFIMPLGARADKGGNLWVFVGNSNVLWSSHTDTVHAKEGRQRLEIGDGLLGLRHDEPSSCLGADCTTGVWIMLNMIRAKVPGAYVFHHGEECGAIGSRFIAQNYPNVLAKYKFAIAFDRKGYSSIITHQGARTASDAFAKSIAPMLPGAYRADDTGTFTDTAMYDHIIPECSNLSIGYAEQHTKYETQDLPFAMRLMETMKTFDETRLVASRDPNDDSESNYYDLESGTMLNLVKSYPHEICDLLETLGYSAKTLLSELEDFRGYK